MHSPLPGANTPWAPLECVKRVQRQQNVIRREMGSGGHPGWLLLALAVQVIAMTSWRHRQKWRCAPCAATPLGKDLALVCPLRLPALR